MVAPPFYNLPHCRVEGSLGGARSLSGHDGEDKNLSHYRKSNEVSVTRGGQPDDRDVH